MVVSNAPRIFTRDPVPSRWNPDHLAGPYELLTLREWEQSVIACSLSQPLRKLLIAAWSDPANTHCRRFQATMGYWSPWLDGAFTAETSLNRFREFLRKEVAAIWYLLDMPFLPCTGMSRAMLLVEHGQYLREVLGALTRKPGALPAQMEVEHALLELMGRRSGCEPWQAQPERTPSLRTMQFHHLRLRRERV